MNQSIYFIGMSKNCFPNLKNNINYLIKYKQFSNFNINICIVDSDSVDGTKKFCKNLVTNKDIDSLIEIDNLEDSHSSRIERLSISRNKGLEYIKKKIDNSGIYVPMDMDLDLFSLTDFSELEKLIENFIDSDSDGLFPYSTPYYYDIFALRKKGWVGGNNLLISNKLKNRFLIFSFFFNYVFIFRQQKHIKAFNEEKIRVVSAFGGIGLYKIYNDTLTDAKYDVSKKEIDFYSEHIFFNAHFNNLFISPKWNIESPGEYTFFKSYNYFNKWIYFLKTLKNDLKNIYLKFKNLFTLTS